MSLLPLCVCTDSVEDKGKAPMVFCRVPLCKRGGGGGGRGVGGGGEAERDGGGGRTGTGGLVVMVVAAAAAAALAMEVVVVVVVVVVERGERDRDKPTDEQTDRRAIPREHRSLCLLLSARQRTYNAGAWCSTSLLRRASCCTCLKTKHS